MCRVLPMDFLHCNILVTQGATTVGCICTGAVRYEACELPMVTQAAASNPFIQWILLPLMSSAQILQYLNLDQNQKNAVFKVYFYRLKWHKGSSYIYPFSAAVCNERSLPKRNFLYVLMQMVDDTSVHFCFSDQNLQLYPNYCKSMAEKLPFPRGGTL